MPGHAHAHARLLKILARKMKQKLFIIFTDFEAAFDLVSRRLLFEKLKKLGVSTVMLSALIGIYITSESVMEHNGQYSEIMLLLAGIKQGAPPSGLLYIAYTMGIIDIFKAKFNPEILISIFHLLMHADDILLLATKRCLAISKLRILMGYCKENCIKLQLTKCAMMCVNSDDVSDSEPITVDGVTLRSEKSEVYLGSVITNSFKLSDDVEADIKHRQINVIKFFAFIRTNVNAPVSIKLIGLQACVLTAILHNAETWANSNVDRLEVIHRRMLKSILGVRTTTCSEFLYIELGVTSMRTQLMIKQWKFWKKVLELNENEPLVYVVKLCKQYKVKEVAHYERLLARYESVEEIVSEFFEKTKASIRRKAENGRTKYATYVTVNPLLETPSVYSSTSGHKNVCVVAKLRTSAHNLQIEMGRRTGTARENRKCHCGGVEDEEHFLTQCPVYEHVRRKHRVDASTSWCTVLGDGMYVEYIKELYEARNDASG